MATLREYLDEMRRGMALYRWALVGVCAVGAWLLVMMTSQLGKFENALTNVSDTLQDVRIGMERITTQVKYLEQERK